MSCIFRSKLYQRPDSLTKTG